MNKKGFLHLLWILPAVILSEAALVLGIERRKK